MNGNDPTRKLVAGDTCCGRQRAECRMWAARLPARTQADLRDNGARSSGRRANDRGEFKYLPRWRPQAPQPGPYSTHLYREAARILPSTKSHEA